MPRDIPVGNGDLLVTFDRLYRVRDIYYPHVGRFDHTDGHVQRFGVWVDGQFAWVEDPGWQRSLKYVPDTLITEVTLRHETLGLEIVCNDAVDFHEPVYMRHAVVQDLLGKDRDVRLFSHWDLSVRGTPVGDTANYDPTTSAVVIYKDDAYFLFNACDENKCGIDNWAIGTKRVRGAEGTWRDAEDGQLGRNAISQGSVDATIGFNLQVPANGKSYVTCWMACGSSYTEVKALNHRIQETGAHRMIARTGSYWNLWVRKDAGECPLSDPIMNLFRRSQLVLRTQIDNGGAIIAANDSDITQFGGDHYSYCWPRDGALVAYSLIITGQSELSRNFFRYCAKALKGEAYFLHKYNPNGELASSWHPWMIEGQRVLPIQQDETSLVMWSLRKHFETFRDVEFVKSLYTPLIVKPAEWTLKFRDAHGLPLPTWDLWEERRGIHTFTVAATIGALRAAAAFAMDFGEYDRAAQFREGAEHMLAALKKHLWNPEQKRFARQAFPLAGGAGYKLDMTSDSANYALFAFAGMDVDDPMVESEMAEMQKRLSVKTGVGGYARYEHDYYHQVEREKIEQIPGNPWVICTLWRAQYVIARAKSLEDLKEAEGLLEWCVHRAEDSGVLAEQHNPYTGEPMSVSPLTWSHATYVMAVIEYARKHEELRKLHAPTTEPPIPEEVTA